MMAPRVSKLEAHHGRAGLLVEGRLRVGQRFTAELDVLVDQLVAAIVRWAAACM